MGHTTAMNAPTVTYTRFRDTWMLRSTEKLELGTSVEVTKKSGETETVKVGEFEHQFKGDNPAFIYGIANW